MTRTLVDLPVYVINLDRRPDRWHDVQQMLARHQFRRVQREAAVDGKLLTTEALEQVTTPESRASLTRPRVRHEELGSVGAVGCTLSHVNVWQRIAASDEPALVVEDDAVLVPELAQYRVFAEPEQVCADYDLVLLGYFALRSPPPAPRTTPQNAVVPYGSLFFGTQFYYLTPVGAQKLLHHALPVEIQLDAYVGTEMTRGRVRAGAHIPSLAWQRGNDTDIQTPCLNCDSSSDTSLRVKLALALCVCLLVGAVTFWATRRKPTHLAYV